MGCNIFSSESHQFRGFLWCVKGGEKFDQSLRKDRKTRAKLGDRRDEIDVFYATNRRTDKTALSGMDSKWDWGTAIALNP